MQEITQRYKKCVLVAFCLAAVFGCSKGARDIIPGRDVKRLSASESGINISIFSDTGRVLYGREFCGLTNGDKVPLSQEVRLEIKRILENAKFARLSQSWKLPVEASVSTDDTRQEYEFLFFEGGFIQAGGNQYYVGISWAPVVKKINDEHAARSRNPKTPTKEAPP
jgi:hypothetical protein